MKNDAPYRTILLTMIISSVLVIATAFYSLTIVENYSMKNILDIRTEKICNRIYDEEQESSELEEQISEEYKARVRTIAIIISSSDATHNHLLLEEMRTAIGADELSLFNENGVITNTTASYIENALICNNIKDNAALKSFSGAFIDENKLFVGISRNDAPGIIQAVFTGSDIKNAVEMPDISKISGDYPLLKRGCTAIIDKSSFIYLSHSQSNMLGLVSNLSADEFTDSSGFFTARVNGRSSLVGYKIYNSNYIVIGAIPKSEVYSKRNTVTGWLIFVCTLMGFVSVLAVRKNYMDKK